MRCYLVRLTAETTSHIVIRVECDGDADDAYDRAEQLLRDRDVEPGLDYAEQVVSTEFLHDGAEVLPCEHERVRLETERWVCLDCGAVGYTELPQ